MPDHFHDCRVSGKPFVWDTHKYALVLKEHGMRFEDAAKLFVQPWLTKRVEVTNGAPRYYLFAEPDPPVDCTSRVDKKPPQTNIWKIVFTSDKDNHGKVCIRLITAYDANVEETIAYKAWKAKKAAR